MRLGLQLGYDDPVAAVALAEEAERCGFHSVWTSEAYGADAVSQLGWIAARTERILIGSAIMQMPARSPAATAATAATLDLLSGGRMLLGLGTSGPQVAEGWHGQAWGKPLERTREYVSIVRAILAREAPISHHGTHYDIPYEGPGATGLGKPLKLILHPLRRAIPLYLGAIGPRNVALAAELADGWMPLFFSPERFRETHAAALEEGFAVRGGRPEGWDLAPLVPVLVADDAAAARDALKPLLALYVGGMGARGQNFYTRLAARYGFEREAETIQEHYLAGRKAEAAAAVPDALVEEIALVGDRARIADRLAAWRASGATSLVLQARQPEALRLLADLV
ncbi:MAG: LLM class F420-dependent oxidoreductase [Thermoleophilia bacterium]|nr:LLM class F420-dependent oxidoreductase [Thermoleophilia bacterium]